MNEHRHTLKNGQTIVVRPMRLEDVPLVDEMHERLSQESLISRYLRPYRPTRQELARIAKIPPQKGMAFVVQLAPPFEQIIGIASYQVTRKKGVRHGEAAFLIEDAYQGMGIGSLLFQHLLDYARSHQVDTLALVMDPTNQRMAAIVRKSGYEQETHYGDGVLESRLPLSTPAPTRATHFG